MAFERRDLLVSGGRRKAQREAPMNPGTEGLPWVQSAHSTPLLLLEGSARLMAAISRSTVCSCANPIPVTEPPKQSWHARRRHATSSSRPPLSSVNGNMTGKVAGLVFLVWKMELETLTARGWMLDRSDE
ncbi:hypothetical protein EYF80_015046 [Liparis tanakae]|uniref:Uncharacterized protein n=1 Tax=Liparis tanakae TaxID=230148 RepID=A0A4Z2I9T3_9TELE|nr:hypothetical protein EYF80_015046 [Liparis tanakae]